MQGPGGIKVLLVADFAPIVPGVTFTPWMRGK
jgi:hypothetical protein